ncbi:MAG: pitrilysin family protein [Planctomycetota bacterium]
MLKRMLLLITLLAIAGCSGTPDLDIHKPTPKSSKVSHPDQLKFPALEVKIPKPERTVLSNGLITFLLEDNELPLITIKVLIRNGAVQDEAGKSGTANLVARLMRTGGTAKYSAEALDEKLEFMSAELSASASYEDMDLKFSFLSRDLTACLDILNEVLFHPAFPEDKLAKEKSRILESIRRQNDQPDAIAGREFRKLLYPTHPFGNEIHGTAETLANITVEDLKAFHQKYFTPSNMMLGVAGSFKKDSMLALLKTHFEGAASDAPRAVPTPRLARTFAKSVNLINKEVNQSVIQFGHLGIDRLNPDYFKIMMMNAILGGSSVSRLYDQIREQRGLAYGVYSYFTLSADTGMFIVDTSTKNESVAEVISIILAEIKNMQTNLVNEEELKNTKEGTLNGFVFRFENPVRVVEQYMYIEHIGLPDNYLATYRDNIMKVTREDIRAAAQKYLKPDDYILLVVGDSKKFDKPLSEFGPVNEIKLENPKAKEEK